MSYLLETKHCVCGASGGHVFEIVKGGGCGWPCDRVFDAGKYRKLYAVWKHSLLFGFGGNIGGFGISCALPGGNEGRVEKGLKNGVGNR